MTDRVDGRDPTRRLETRLRTVLSNRMLPTIVIFLAGACVIALVRVATTVGLTVPFGYNEGWNAYFASAAMTGKSLYPPPQSLMVNNYPPLSFYIVGAVGRALGDMIIAGRIVSLLGLLWLLLAVFAALRIMACSPLEASFAILALTAYLLCESDRVGMDDPNLLGLAVALTGFLLVLSQPRRLVALTCAALLFTLAFFIKHNLIILPLVMTFWLVSYDRRSALRLTIIGLTLLGTGLAVCRFGLGVDLIAQLHSARTYSPHRLAEHLSRWLTWGSFPILVVIWLFSKYRSDKYVMLCSLYVLVAFMLGAVFSGGAGVDMNAMFDCDIALVLVAGLALNRVAAGDAIRTGAIVGAFVLPLVFIGSYKAVKYKTASALVTTAFWLHPMDQEAELARRDIRFLRVQHGRVLCHTLALCYWAQKNPEVDVFNIGQEFILHVRRDGGLVGEISTCRFAALQLATPPSRWAALGPRVRQAIEHNYHIDHNDAYGMFLVRTRTGHCSRSNR